MQVVVNDCFLQQNLPLKGRVGAMAMAGESPREMLVDLAARGDECRARVATALETLVDDLAKAHADAASSAVNNVQQFHHLDHETLAARTETECMTKLQEDSDRVGEDLQEGWDARQHIVDYYLLYT